MFKFLFYTTSTEKIVIAIIVAVVILAVAANLFGNAAGQSLVSAISKR